METDVMLRPFWDSCERTRIRTKLSSQPCDAVNAWHLPVQMAGGVVETEADPAGKLVQKYVSAAPAARRTLKPRKCPVSPHNQDPVPVDPKIGAVSGELVSPIAPFQLRHHPIDERTYAVKHCRVESCAVLDQTIDRDAGELITVVQSKARYHERETISPHPAGQAVSLAFRGPFLSADRGYFESEDYIGSMYHH
jgi:hypothetical protein